jgi:hypothetical protein
MRSTLYTIISFVFIFLFQKNGHAQNETVILGEEFIIGNFCSIKDGSGNKILEISVA